DLLAFVFELEPVRNRVLSRLAVQIPTDDLVAADADDGPLDDARARRRLGFAHLRRGGGAGLLSRCHARRRDEQSHPQECREPPGTRFHRVFSLLVSGNISPPAPKESDKSASPGYCTSVGGPRTES